LSESILIDESVLVLLTPLKSIDEDETPEPVVLNANALLTSVLFVELKSVELLTSVLFFVLNASEFEDTILLEAFTANDLLKTLLLSESILILDTEAVLPTPLKSIELLDTPELIVLNANEFEDTVLLEEFTENDLLKTLLLLESMLIDESVLVFAEPLNSIELFNIFELIVLNASEFEDIVLFEEFTENDLLETLLLSDKILIPETEVVLLTPLKSIEDEETPEPTVLNAIELFTNVLFLVLNASELEDIVLFEEFIANDLSKTLLLSESILILDTEAVLPTPLKSIEDEDTPEPVVLNASALLTNVLFVELKSVELLTSVLFFVLNASEFEDTILLEAFTANDLLEILLLSESMFIDESVLVFAEPLKSIEDEETPEPIVLNANALLTIVLFVELTEKDLLYKSVLVDNILTLCKSRVFKFPLILTELLFTISEVSKTPNELFDIFELVFLIDTELLLTVFPDPFISKDPVFK